MSVVFDPYHKWLGIPLRDQPPNHYRLLGIELFESDAEVISHAADQRMAHLRVFQTGQHGKISQRLLNEVAAVKLCLLNPARKRLLRRAIAGETCFISRWRRRRASAGRGVHGRQCRPQPVSGANRQCGPTHG